MQNFTHSRYSRKQEKYFPKCFESGFTSRGDAHTVGKIGFISHIKPTAEAIQGFTSFMRDNI